MESLHQANMSMDDLLDFSSDIGECEEEEEEDEYDFEKTKNPLLSSCTSFSLLPRRSKKTASPFPDFVEEELEWISNKDAFPMVESFVDIIPNHPSFAATTTTATTTTTTTNHQSPVSVLENSSCSMNSTASHSSSSGGSSSSRNAAVSPLTSTTFKVPGKARSKQGRKRRRDMLGQQWQCWAQQYERVKAAHKASSGGAAVPKPSSTIGRKCLHCQAEKTPQWRAGPFGPKTLCNACGVRYKSGRLVPEYRPASSPTFSMELHSNSHRKIVEMRRQKIGPGDVGFMKNVEIG